MNKKVAVISVSMLLIVCMAACGHAIPVISGQVTSAGNVDISDAIVVVFDQNGKQGEPYSVVPVQNGAYTVEIKDDGAYTVSAMSEKDESITSIPRQFTVKNGRIEGDSKFDFELAAVSGPNQEAQITGAISNMGGRKEVYVLASVEKGGKPLMVMPADENGSFSISGLDDGQYFIMAQAKDGSESESVMVTISAGKNQESSACQLTFK